MATTAAPLPLIPNLGGIIKASDVSTKGTGNYAASYVNWARTAALLHEHAPGWQFEAIPTADGALVHGAPDGTGYILGRFIGPDGAATTAFPQACMDHRNNPIPWERITARVLTDTHRRCLCAAAAFTFGLAYELWAREELEDPMRSDASSAAAVAAPPAPPKAPPRPPKSPPTDAAPASPELSPDDSAMLVGLLRELPPARLKAFNAEFRKAFQIPDDGKPTSAHITSEAHKAFAERFLTAVPA